MEMSSGTKGLPFTLLLLLLTLSVRIDISLGVGGGQKPPVPACEPLIPSSENVVLICGGGAKNCSTDCSQPQRPGSTVKYKCRQYFVPLGGQGEGKGEDTRQAVVMCGASSQWTTGISRFNSFFCVEDCGRRKINPKPLIINGVVTERLSWPWHATIFYRSSTSASAVYKYICGGSIVRNSIVLTAAHCVTSVTAVGGADELPPELFAVAIGAESNDYYANHQNPTVQVFNVKKIYYIYESYEPGKDFQADIAILHLEPGMQFSDYVVPICLPRDSVLDVNALRPGQVGQVAGFGVDESGNTSALLKYGDLLVKSRAQCFHTLDAKLSESQFCAGTLKGDGKWTSVCNGDSGGGLVFPAPTLEKYYMHGLVSFAANQANPCQNNAVFTRILPFMDWIRTVLETIQGEVLKDLATNLEIPYVQSPTSRGVGHKTSFSPWPRELDDRLTSVHLSNVRINADDLLNALERTKLLHTLSMTDVRVIGGPFKRRVRLPYLKTFVLDMAQKDWNGHAKFVKLFPGEYEDRPPPPSPSALRQFLDSALLFNKDYDEEWNLERLARLGVDIQLTFNYVKLITLNHAARRLMLNGVPGTSAILRHLPPESEFRLRHLHLKKCRLNFTEISSRARALPHEHLQLETLVLVEILTPGRKGEGGFLRNLLRKTPDLQELVVDTGENDRTLMEQMSIELEHLPHKSLRHLVLSRVWVSLREAGDPSPAFTPTASPHPTRIVFPGDRDAMATKFPKVRSLWCEYCQMEPGLLEILHIYFPTLETLVFTSDTIELGMPEEEFASKFKHLTLFRRTTHDAKYTSITTTITLTREAPGDGDQRGWTWTRTEGRPTTQLYFNSIGLPAFYTSWWDNFRQRRHTKQEVVAIETGVYEFEGETDSDRDGGTMPTEKLPTIEFSVHKYLKSVQIRNVELFSDDLFVSLHEAQGLEVLNLTGIYLLDPIHSHVELPRLKEAVLSYQRVLQAPPSFDERNLRTLIPFKAPLEALALSGVNTSSSSLDRFTLENEGRILLKWSRPAGYVVLSRLDFAGDILKNLSRISRTRPHPVETLVVCDSSVPLENIPDTVKFLYLTNVRMGSETNPEVTKSLGRLRRLEHLRIFELPVNLHQPVDVPLLKLYLSELPAATSTLQDIHASGVIVSMSRSGGGDADVLPVFNLVQTLAFETFAMDRRVVDSFWAMFPNVSNLTILSPSLEFIPEYQRLFLSALANEKVHWIRGTFRNAWNKTIIPVFAVSAGDVTELESQEHNNFYMERVNGVWTRLKVGEDYWREMDAHADVHSLGRWDLDEGEESGPGKVRVPVRYEECRAVTEEGYNRHLVIIN